MNDTSADRHPTEADVARMREVYFCYLENAATRVAACSIARRPSQAGVAAK